MATLQITNPLGLTLLFNFGAPEMAFSTMTAIALLACAGFFQWLALALAGALVTAPIAHLGFFIVLSFITTYLIYAQPQLGRLWVWVQVPILSAFYSIIFQPATIVSDGGDLWAGLAVASALLLLCNRLLWPRPPALALRKSAADMIGQSRGRLHSLFRVLLEGDELALEDDHPIPSRLGYHLTLLPLACRHARNRSEAAELLTSVILSERLRHAIDRFASALHIVDRATIAGGALAELARISTALDTQFERHAESVITGEIRTSNTASARDRSPLLRLQQFASESVLEPLLTPLIIIFGLLEIDPMELPPPASPTPLEPCKPMAVANRFLLRFSARHTAALTIAFLIGLWDNTPALQAALWLLMIGGPPTHGATLRKFTMRTFGSVGALSLAALASIMVAPNFTSLPPYLLAIFIGTLLMAYAGESGGILSFLSVGGTPFVIAFSGPGPRPDIIGSIWTIWGVSLGMVIRATVSLLSRERASQTLAEQFQPPLASIIALLNRTADEATGSDQIAAAEMELITGIGKILEVANDAQLEGRTAGLDATVLIAAVDTLRRLGCLIGNIRQSDYDNQSHSTPIPAEELEALRLLFASWLQYLQAQTGGAIVSRAPLRDMVTESAQAPFSPFKTADGSTPAEPLSDSAFNPALIERLLSLAGTLAEQFTRISLDHDFPASSQPG
ncbi:MAG: hypothetical protein ABSG46_00645 [Candidatus Binataceae bacterium]